MKNFFLLIFFLLLTCQLHAQSVTVKGTITDSENKDPLPGVSVLIKGTTQGTATTTNGGYSIDVPKGAVLTFSFIGYSAKEVTVGSETIIDVSLSPDTQILSEVTVTALGIKREKRALGYAVSDVGSENIANNGETNAIASIAGKVAGVSISSTTAGATGSSRVVIRGIRELQGSNQPLYVIDGVPAVNGNIGSASQWGGFDLGDGLSDINPNDIESISVLKGSAAAALYGSRALNGVILITTKSGKANKGIGIELNSSFTIDQISTRMDERQKVYGQGNDGVFPTDPLQSRNITSNWGPKFTDFETITQADGTVRPYKYMDDNIQDFFRAGKTSMNTIAVSGGKDDNTVRLSYSNIANSDIVPKSGYDKNIFAIRATSKITNNLTVDTKINYMTEKVRNRPALTDEVNNIGNGLLGLAANFDQAWLQDYMNPDGTYKNYTGNIYRSNPYWTLNKTFNKSTKERAGGYINLTYKINSMFSLNLQAGTDFFSFNHENFYDKYTPAYDGGALNQLSMNTNETNFQGLLNFNKDLGKDFKISALAGANLMRYRSKGDNISATQIIEKGTANLVNFTEKLIQPFDNRKEIQSVFASAQLSFREYLFLNLQGRNDWASTLPPQNNSFFYPSVDASFVITDAFKIETPALSFAKLRASYGQVGSDFDPYKTTFAYSLTGRSLRGFPMGEILGTSIPNADLKPQIKTSFELGTDIRLLHDRIGLDLTYYDEVTNDVLLDITVPETTGFNSASLNAAKLRNRGFEILLNTVPVKLNNGFQWDLSFNFARNVNEVVELSDLLETFTVAEARWAGATIIAEKGKPFGTIKGNGFLRDDNGNRVFNSSNGEPLPTTTPITLGNTLPDWTGGMITSVSFKGLQLKAALDVRVGGDIFSMTNMTMHMNGSHANTEEGRDSWNSYQQDRQAAQRAAAAAGAEANLDDPTSPYYVNRANRGFIGAGVNQEGAPNTIPISPAAYWQSIGNNIPEPFIYDGGYIKLRDLGLNYTFSSSLLKKTPFKTVTFGVIGRNLWIISKNTPNIDPESNYNNGNGQGFEYGSLPGRKRYGFNLVVKF
ncbi:SusC/RagA family TonB-linked outer membrane protein [Dyadobacter psychrotolerans]|uniref:SusC/RagA family TonB-linked outer membrane protein n=1 Tax=Dyadobacter psychrotolerans TaxID=2541721 RepID=A0A4V2Z4F8_9BACT|nr:SusC/RagA family TonB-linked outer membrane protein [Dyadobacter psychrotolerans]TDE16478.1 SusC/RagA family TonB-linked outer membrane protein [Dyadobacter psychrotolerans]